MSMMYGLTNELRKLEERLEHDGVQTYEASLVSRATEAIEALSDKLYAAEMEQSNAYYNGGWIPCEERLPEEYTEVLVWYEYRKGGSSNGKMVQTYGIGWRSMNGWHGDVYGFDARCIAWMPLPEPYKGD